MNIGEVCLKADSVRKAMEWQAWAMHNAYRPDLTVTKIDHKNKVFIVRDSNTWSARWARLKARFASLLMR